MRFVLVQAGVVTSAIELDPRWNDPVPNGEPVPYYHWTAPAGATVVQSDSAGAGWTYNGATFTAPPPNPDPPVPSGAELSALDDATLTGAFNGGLGSVDRALARTLFKIVKGQIAVPQPSLTQAQFLAFLKNEMR